MIGLLPYNEFWPDSGMSETEGKCLSLKRALEITKKIFDDYNAYF